jgi:hypothetical protein
MAKINIFDELDSAEICYSVIANSAYLNNPSQQFATDWFILGSVKDRDKLKKLKFRVSKCLRKSVMERDITESEYAYFKAMTSTNKYIKVINNKEGKVYELKMKSFKEYHNE